MSLCGAGEKPAAAGNASGGNPYSFYGSVAECAAAERNRCDDCLPGGSCTAITGDDGNAECTQLGGGDGRGYFLICINLALAIDAVDACTASAAPSCPRDRRASESISSLESNALFLDDPACAAPLDSCLATLYGGSRGGFPGPGPGDVSSPPPRNTSIDCSDSCSGDTSCDSSPRGPGCELDGSSCDASSDASCSDSGDSSGCGDSSGDPGSGDSCSGDSEDSCGSEDNSSCDSSDCGGGGGGNSDCSSDGGGGDCSGGGESDCSGGGGGDCSSGGGGDCNVAGRRSRVGTSLPVTVAWALLPVPFAILVRRRAERRRARAASGEGEGAPGLEREAAP